MFFDPVDLGVSSKNNELTNFIKTNSLLNKNWVSKILKIENDHYFIQRNKF